MLKLPYLPQPPKKARANLYIYSNDRIEIRSKEAEASNAWPQKVRELNFCLMHTIEEMSFQFIVELGKP